MATMLEEKLSLTVGCICSVRFETLNFTKPMNLIRRINVGLTTEPHITYTPCYMLCGFNPQTFIR